MRFLLIGGAVLAGVLLATRKASGASEGGPPSGSPKGDGGAPGGAPGAPEKTKEASVEDLTPEYGTEPILPVIIPQYRGTITSKSQPKDWPGKWANLGSFGANGGAHLGVDFSAEFGTILVAVATGKVISVTKEGDPANKNTIGGTTVTIAYSYDGHEWTAYYAHMRDVFVKKGDSVVLGQQIGTIGNTGNARATGPHCHFELKKDGKHVDPLKNLKAVA